MKRWTGRPPALTPEQSAEARRIGLARAAVAALPTYEELARRWGASVNTVQHHARGRGPKRYAKEMPT